MKYKTISQIKAIKLKSRKTERQVEQEIEQESQKGIKITKVNFREECCKKYQAEFKDQFHFRSMQFVRQPPSYKLN